MAGSTCAGMRPLGIRLVGPSEPGAHRSGRRLARRPWRPRPPHRARGRRTLVGPRSGAGHITARRRGVTRRTVTHSGRSPATENFGLGRGAGRTPTRPHGTDSLSTVAEPVDDEYVEDGDDDEPEAPRQRVGAAEHPLAADPRADQLDRPDHQVVGGPARRPRAPLFPVRPAAALVFGVLIYVTETNNKHFHLAKGQFTPFTTLVVGLVAAAFLLVATLGSAGVPWWGSSPSSPSWHSQLGVRARPPLRDPRRLAALPVLQGPEELPRRTAGRPGTGERQERGVRPGIDRPARLPPARSRAAAEPGRRQEEKGPPAPSQQALHPEEAGHGRLHRPPKPSWRERRAAKASD